MVPQAAVKMFFLNDPNWPLPGIGEHSSWHPAYGLVTRRRPFIPKVHRVMTALLVLLIGVFKW